MAVSRLMADTQWTQFVEVLTDRGIAFDRGLSEAEAERVERTFGFRFPPDLREFLQAGLPVGGRFPNWRDEDEALLRERLRQPLEGVLFDVEHNGFWLPAWGERPAKVADAQAVVRKLVEAAPILVPVYGHRMMPDRPHEVGNPVFSVHQTDIIYYRVNLRDYLIHEFLAPRVSFWPISDSVRQIEFWDIKAFLQVRWAGGSAIFDNRAGGLS